MASPKLTSAAMRLSPKLTSNSTGLSSPKLASNSPVLSPNLASNSPVLSPKMTSNSPVLSPKLAMASPARNMSTSRSPKAASPKLGSVPTDELVDIEMVDISNVPTNETELIEGESKDLKRKNDDGLSRLKVFNLPHYVKQKDLVKKLEELGVVYQSIEKDSKVAYKLVFEDAPRAQEAYSLLKGASLKGKALEVKFSNNEPKQPVQRKARKEDPNDTRTPAERLADQTSPLWRMPYDDQLAQKRNFLVGALTEFRKNLYKCVDNRAMKGAEFPDVDLNDLDALKKLDPPVRACLQLAWMRDARQAEGNQGLLVHLPPIVPSPVLSGYRTKNEFTIGRNLANEPTVGFLLGSFQDGMVLVEDPKDSILVPDSAKAIALCVQNYIRLSHLTPFDRVSHEGFWRLCLVRTQSTGDNMVIIQSDTTQASEQDVIDAKEGLKAALSKETGLVNTLLFQSWNGAHNGFKTDEPLELMFGEGVVHEELFGIDFQISPTSFFQVNKPATEILYGKIRSLALDAYGQESKNVILLDLCCGTGTIGIAVASHFKKVIGIELVPEAIEDAKANAVRNNITNIEFICAKVEDAIKTVFKTMVTENDVVVAVVDPPRNGVHPSVSGAIRSCHELKNVIYVSCDAKQSQSNWTELCRPTSNNFHGIPFKPVESFAVDMFPHTNHVELIMYLKR